MILGKFDKEFGQWLPYDTETTKYIGECTNCGEPIYSNDIGYVEGERDGLFCTKKCLRQFYGINRKNAVKK